MIKKIDHIGLAVKSIDETKTFFEKTLGLACEGMEEVPTQKVKTAFFSIGEVHIELLEATSDDSPVAKFIEKNGPGVHHIAYGTDDVQKQLDQASATGCKLINQSPVDGAGGKQVGFLHPKSTFGVLTEFCAKK